jgi:hypothetical protein
MRRALLVGLNYPGTSYPLRGCADDSSLLRQALLSPAAGFDAANIRVVASGTPAATRDGLMGDAFAWLLAGARAPGDALFFGFSGHGVLVPGSTDDAIVAADGAFVSNQDLKNALLARVPPGARLTCVFDCCHSGGLGGLPNAIVPSGARPAAAAAVKAALRRASPVRLPSARLGGSPSARAGPPPAELMVYSACLTSQIASDGASSMRYVRQPDGTGAWVATPSQGAFTAAFAPAAAAALAAGAAGTPRTVLTAIGRGFAASNQLQTPVLSTTRLAAVDEPFAPWLRPPGGA